MKKLLGSIISGVGLLIAGTSGLCSLVLLGAGISQEGIAGLGHAIMPVLIVGGPTFGIGLGIALAGRDLVRQAKSKATKATAGTLQEPREQQPTTPSSPQNP